MANVLFIQPSLSGIGSIEKIIPMVANGLREHDYGIMTMSFYDQQEFHPKWSSKHVSLHELPSAGIYSKIKKIVKRSVHIVKYVRTHKPDIIIISTHGSSLIGLLLKCLRLIQVPVLIYVHQALSASDRGYMMGTNLLYRAADGFICVSEGVATEVKSLLPHTSAPIIVAYNPVRSSVVDVPGELSYAPKEHPVLISAARLEQIRGVDLLIDFCCLYFKTNPGELVILGDGSLKATLMKKVSDAGLGARIHFIGAVENVQDYLRLSDIYVSLARAEALGVALIEALASGKPIVCADVPYGPREVMNIRTPIAVYPHESEYGFLLSSTAKLSETQKFNVYQQFCTVISTDMKHKFPVASLTSRAAYFSMNNTTSAILDLLTRIEKRTV